MFRIDTMKQDSDDYELDDEYDLSQLPIIPKGRYKPKRRGGTILVLLDPDVSRAFPTAEAVNQALRLAIQLAQIPVEKSEQFIDPALKQM